jgi:hypothetical protein
MEKLMEVMCCTDEQKVCYATFKLTDEAERWWVSKKDHLQQQLGQGVPITWKNFKDSFLERFFPQSVRQAKAHEFIDLVQGPSTVEQYAAKFIELSRFAPYLVPTEDLKARKFERGLQPRIMNQVVGFEIDNLMDMVNKVAVIKRTLKTNAEHFNQKKRSAPQWSRFWGYPHNPNKRRFNPTAGRNIAPQQPNQQGGGGQCPTCQTCGKMHFGRYRVGQVCYKCGGPRHFARECRTPVNNLTNQNRPGGQRNTAPARVYALTPGDIAVSNEVVTGTLLIASCQATILFDSEATHSFVSSSFTRNCGLRFEQLDVDLAVTTPIGKTVVCTSIVKDCPISVRDQVMPANLVIF